MKEGLLERIVLTGTLAFATAAGLSSIASAATSKTVSGTCIESQRTEVTSEDTERARKRATEIYFEAEAFAKEGNYSTAKDYIDLAVHEYPGNENIAFARFGGSTHKKIRIPERWKPTLSLIYFHEGNGLIAKREYNEAGKLLKTALTLGNPETNLGLQIMARLATFTYPGKDADENDRFVRKIIKSDNEDAIKYLKDNLTQWQLEKYRIKFGL